MDLSFILLKVLYALIVIGVLMGLAAYSVLGERKVSAWIQGRVGPNRTSLPLLAKIPVLGPLLCSMGIWQPLADGLKFLFKEDPMPGHVKKGYYILAPIVVLIPALSTVALVPFGMNYESQMPLGLANIELGLWFIFALASLGVYGIILGGWAANSKYPFFGGIRACAQLISYELLMGLSVLPVIIWVNGPGSTVGLSLAGIAQAQEGAWFFMLQPVGALVFLIALFAETNRLPFDMPESETELVGGFHTEYGSFKFGFFFLAEYAHMLVGSAVFTHLFLGGWHFLPWMSTPWPETMLGTVCSVVWFLGKVLAMMFFFMWVRWTLPRFRYDQVMQLAWGRLLPIALVNLVIYTIIAAY
jgi:NADH-quinone oxidoreductase subunit H